MATTKKNQQDSTLRNVRSANRKIEQLKRKVDDLTVRVKAYRDDIRYLHTAVYKLQNTK